MGLEIETSLLYDALGEEIGSVITSTDVPLAIQRLNRAKRESGDSALSIIQIRQNPLKSDELWLTKGKIKQP